MRRLIITDLHGKNPRELIDEISSKQDITSVICLGDIESAEITEYLLNRKSETIIVPGNHDYPYMNDCYKILKGIEVQKDQSPDYLPCNPQTYWANVEKWLKSPMLRAFAEKIIAYPENEKRFQYDLNVGNEKIVCVHASLFDDSKLQSNKTAKRDNQNEPYQLWTRMYSLLRGDHNPVIKGNFEIMKDYNFPIWMIFRGHDWGQRLSCIDRKSQNLNEYISQFNPIADQINFKLSKDQCYIASFGSYQCDQYSIFDDKNFTLEFYNPKRKIIK